MTRHSKPSDGDGPMRDQPAARRRPGAVRVASALLFLLVAACVAMPPVPATSPMPRGKVILDIARWSTLPAGYDRGIATLSRQRWKQLVTVDRDVDREIIYASDPDVSVAPGAWMLPLNNRGNCVSIALEKMKQLLELGWPRNALRVGVVWPQGHKEMHAVLTIETSVGTFVLDQLKAPDPIAWTAGHYFWVAREHPEKGKVRWEYFPTQPTASLPLPSCG